MLFLVKNAILSYARSPAGLKDNSCLLTPPLTRPCQPAAPSPRVLASTSQSSAALPLALESMQRALHH